MSEVIEREGQPYSQAHLLKYPAEYFTGIDLFNAGEFHAAHDAWEDRWRGPVGAGEKLFLQAMIQSAVAFHHLEIGKPGAARRMHQIAREKFERLGSRYFMSLDLEDFQRQLWNALSWLESGPDPREIVPPAMTFPKISLVAETMDFD